MRNILNVLFKPNKIFVFLFLYKQLIKMYNIMKNLITTLLLSIALVSNAQISWDIIYNNYLDESFFDLSYINEQNAWAVGSNGHILHSDNGGIDWDIQFQNSDAWFYGCFFLNDQQGWVVGWNEVYYTYDGGQTWYSQNLPNPLGLGANEAFFINQDTGWIVGDYQTIYVTYNGGEEWLVQNHYVLANHKCFQDVYFYDALHGMAVGGGLTSSLSIVMKTDDGGVNWEEISIPGNSDLVNVFYTEDGYWWISDEDSKLYKSNDCGMNWEIISIEYGYLQKLHFFNNDTAILLDNSGKICITNDAWNTWDVTNNYYGLSLNAMDFCDEMNGIAIGWETETIKTNNGGYNWEKVSNDFIKIAFFDVSNGWMINGYPNKNLLHTNDGGTSWNFVETPNTGEIWKLCFPTEEVGYAFCDENEMMKTNDSGNSWNVIYVPDSIKGGVYFINQDTGFMCSNNGYFSKTFDGGQTWNSIKVNDSINLRSLFFLNSNEGWVTGNFGFYAHTFDGGQTWETGFLDSYMPSDVYFIDSLKGFITTYQGFLYKTTDGGINWDKISGFESSLLKIVFTDSINGWIINNINKIYHTPDGGKSWETEYTFENYGISDIFFLDDKNGWVCKSNGVIAKYSETTNIEETNPNSEISIYPNPVSDKLFLNPDKKIKFPLVCQIYSINGRLLRNKIFRYRNATLSINVSHFSKGLYILKFSGKEMTFETKFIKN